METETSVRSQRSYEKLKISHYYLFFNRSTKFTEDRAVLEQIITKNILSGEEPLAGWSKNEGERKTTYQDSESDPRFFAKLKWLDKVTFRYFKEKNDENIKSGQGGQGLGRLGRLNGVINELSMARTISETVADDETQEYVRRYGFKGIEFVEPLAAIIDQETGNKILVYLFADGKSGLAYTQGKGGTDEFLNGLREIFRSKNINPVDFKSSQLIVSEINGVRSLYLIDTELFTKVGPSDIDE